MDEIEEKRVYGDRAGGAELLVAAGIGVLSVSVSANRVGRFGVAHRCEPTDLAAGEGRVAVATAEDVLVREPGAEAFAATGFGAAVAVGVDGTDPVAASYAGLDDARDVAAAGPLAATGDGLYSLGNGWMDERAGDFRVVAASEGMVGDGARDVDARAHAVATDGVYGRAADGWRAVDLPVEGPVVDVAYGPAVYLVTADGDLLASDGDGWRVQALGVADVVGCAVV